MNSRLVTQRLGWIANVCAVVFAAQFSASAQITVTAPAANETLRAADDFATLAFQDPWDMNQWTDLGWYTFGIDAPVSNLTNIGFANGIFSATGTASTPPNFWLLDPFTPTSAPLGKIGSLFPIDSTKYRRFLIRMNLSGSGLVVPATSTSQSAQFIWNLYGTQSTSNAFFTYPNWWVYSVDLPTLGAAAGPAWAASNPVQSLRFAPVGFPNINIQVDWARLTPDDPTLHRTITWTGSGGVDIFLDNDTNFANGYIGQIATNVTGGSFDFFVGGLPAGTYRVAIRPFNSASAPSYSAGAWTVNDIPTLTFTAPNPEGSADDFATTQLNNPWDMNALSDIDYSLNVANLAITNIPARDEAGNNLGNVRVLSGTTTSNFGDPEIFPLWWNARGTTYHIDTSRYRILSLKWGIVENRDINAGSIGRLIWRVFGEAVENVSNDIILKHLPNANVIQSVITDMKTLELEPGAGSPSHTGWNGTLDGFRVKHDEFSHAVPLYIQYVKLSAFEKANASYAIQWSYANQGTAAPTLQLFYDTTGTGFSGTQIVAGLNPTAGTYTWNTSGIANGTYYIYARIVNGTTVMNQSYARWPIIVDHSSGVLPSLVLDRANVYLGATNNGSTATTPQVVHVNTAPGVNWTVSSSVGFFAANPTSGTGSGSFTIGVSSSTLPSPSTLNGVISVNSSGVSNSPQFVNAYVVVVNPSAVGAPFGSFDTPTDGVTGVAGAIAVTGWALDNIEVTSVEIDRDPVTGEAPGPNGLIFIGNATFVEGARPDVAAAYPSTPLRTRAGWGYLLLTNFLPNSSGSGPTGNGTYKLHAIAHSKTGQTTQLGTKTITVDNAHANKPFGTIDTPDQGGTASGTQFVNFGWALTPQPQCIATDASTITVTVDGVTLGHPVYNQKRADIANAFPNYCNTTGANGAVGYFILNTTSLTNGVHTLGWLVYDNIGRGDGIGSRFINVLNGGASAAPEPSAVEPTANVTLKQGFDLNSPAQEVAPDSSGAYSVEMDQLGRIELNLGATAGYEIFEGQRQALPIGSTLKDGTFYWHAGPGFLGRFELVFERANGTTVPVHVTIHRKNFGRSGAVR